MIWVVLGYGILWGVEFKAAAHPPSGSLCSRTTTRVELYVDVPWLNAHTLQLSAALFHHPNG